MGNFEVIKI